MRSSRTGLDSIASAMAIGMLGRGNSEDAVEVPRPRRPPDFARLFASVRDEPKSSVNGGRAMHKINARNQARGRR
jgi:hypothetical protein